MTLATALDYVRGAVDTTQFVPVLKDYALRDGMLQGSDGVVTLNARVDSSLPAMCLHAQRFAQAVLACDGDDEIELSLTDTGNLRVRAGRFRAIVPATPNADTYPWYSPDPPVTIDVPDTFLACLRSLVPFIGTDATRPFSMSVLIHGGYMYATNNVICVRVPTDTDANMHCAIPHRAIAELLRIGNVPIAMGLDNDSIVFYHSRHWWLRALLVLDPWPDSFVTIFAGIDHARMVDVSDDLRDAIARLAPFATSTSPLFITGGHVRTSLNDDEGAAVSGIDGMHTAYTVSMLRRVLSVATMIDCSAYPKPTFFAAPNGLEGAIATYTMPTRGPDPQPVKRSGK